MKHWSVIDIQTEGQTDLKSEKLFSYICSGKSFEIVKLVEVNSGNSIFENMYLQIVCVYSGFIFTTDILCYFI